MKQRKIVITVAEDDLTALGEIYIKQGIFQATKWIYQLIEEKLRPKSESPQAPEQPDTEPPPE